VSQADGTVIVAGRPSSRVWAACWVCWRTGRGNAAAKHDRIRVFAAETLLRVDDEPLRVSLLRDKRLAALGLAEVQPGLLGSSKKPAAVMAALRSAGHAPVGPADKPRKLPAGRPVEPVSWRIRYADPAAVVADLRSLGGPPHEALSVRAAPAGIGVLQAMPADDAVLDGCQVVTVL